MVDDADRGARLILGAILAGGLASRFGSDKGAALLDGSALIDHVGARLGERCDEIIVVGRAWGGLRQVADWPRSGLGPLAGVAAATRHAIASGAQVVLTIGCDMPNVPDALFGKLIAQAPAYCDDAPILATWRPTWADAIVQTLEKGGSRSIRRCAQALGATAIDWPDGLANINTPADLAALAASRPQ